MSNPVIIWLRRDLRLTDHRPFHEAITQGRRVIPVYIADGEERAWRPGAASRWWLHHSLTALAVDLRARGNQLLVRRGAPGEVLRELAGETGADTVWWHCLYEPDAVAKDTAVKERLRAAGLEARSFSGALLHEPARFFKKDGTAYRVFTPFWKALSATLDPQGISPPPRQLPCVTQTLAGLSVDELGLLPRHGWGAGLAAHWQPGEAKALMRLRSFCDGAIADYHRTRDLPAMDGVSRLSPHLHFGELTPRQVWHAVHNGAQRGTEGATAFVRELGWREFAHAILFHFPHTPEEPLASRFARFPWRVDHDRLLDAWQRGCTGYPLVDAGMREMWATGWMHNRVRMVAASLLVKNLRVPWQAGAQWFWETLVDADLANNTLGWQWVAGCGADAAPYFRVFNPQRQLERFDPDGTYVRRWVPEWGTKDYPAPVVDFAASRDEALAALKSMGDA